MLTDPFEPEDKRRPGDGSVASGTGPCIILGFGDFCANRGHYAAVRWRTESRQTESKGKVWTAVSVHHGRPEAGASVRSPAVGSSRCGSPGRSWVRGG